MERESECVDCVGERTDVCVCVCVCVHKFVYFRLGVCELVRVCIRYCGRVCVFM